MNNTVKNNIKIAEFLGMVYIENSKVLRDKRKKPYTVHRSTELKYHNDWNCLMEVVEKIEENYFFIIDGGNVEISTHLDCTENSFIITKETLKIKAVLNAVLEFIDWFNSNKK